MAKKAGTRWWQKLMDTYGDMVTLLMTFFIAMYSMSTIQEDKWAELVKAFNIHGTEKVDQIVFTVENDGDDLVDNSGDSNGYNPGDANDDSDDVDFSDLYNYLKEHIENNMADSIYIEKGSSKTVLQMEMVKLMKLRKAMKIYTYSFQIMFYLILMLQPCFLQLSYNGIYGSNIKEI